MSRDHQLFLDDIYLSCKKIIRYTQGITFEQFMADEKTFDAVVRNLIVIGEAVKHIPQVVRDRYQQIQWREIAGFRDIAIHEYFGIDEDILWDIIQNEIPSLTARMMKIKSQEK